MQVRGYVPLARRGDDPPTLSRDGGAGRRSSVAPTSARIDYVKELRRRSNDPGSRAEPPLLLLVGFRAHASRGLAECPAQLVRQADGAGCVGC
jgi:hypothetical protein